MNSNVICWSDCGNVLTLCSNEQGQRRHNQKHLSISSILRSSTPASFTRPHHVCWFWGNALSLSQRCFKLLDNFLYKTQSVGGEGSARSFQTVNLQFKCKDCTAAVEAEHMVQTKKVTLNHWTAVWMLHCLWTVFGVRLHHLVFCLNRHLWRVTKTTFGGPPQYHWRYSFKLQVDD